MENLIAMWLGQAVGTSILMLVWLRIHLWIGRKLNTSKWMDAAMTVLAWATMLAVQWEQPWIEPVVFCTIAILVAVAASNWIDRRRAGAAGG